jgi:putative oxidoreductase
MLYIIGRILVPSVFVALGVERLLMFAGVLSGGPVSAGAAAFSAFELLIGLLIMAGYKVRWLAALMAAFIFADAMLAHPFWIESGDARHAQLLHFFKNMSTLGGLLLLVAVAPTRKVA